MEAPLGAQEGFVRTFSTAVAILAKSASFPSITAITKGASDPLGESIPSPSQFFLRSF
jgi:hypothetical protein